MGLVSRTLTTAALGLTLTTGCASHATYPPALPSQVQIPWLHNEPLVAVTPPPAELRYQSLPPPRSAAAALVPSADEWALWKPQVTPKRVCSGKGTRRTCRLVVPSAVERANVGAVVKPSAQHTAFGTSAQTRYPLDLRGQKIYEVHTSPTEATYLLLPEGERLAAKLLLNPQQWEVTYGKSGSEGSRREVVALRAIEAPLTARGLLVLQSGLTIHLQILAKPQPGMLSVTWELPEQPPTPPDVPLDQRPPQFDASRAYAGYTVTLEGKNGFQPPWYPAAVVDDGKSTLVSLPQGLEGVRLPVVSGVQQNGKPALVQSRLYVRPDHGAWMYIQGIWPALTLQDAAGLRVKLVRQPPSPITGVTHAH